VVKRTFSWLKGLRRQRACSRLAVTQDAGNTLATCVICFRISHDEVALAGMVFQRLFVLEAFQTLQRSRAQRLSGPLEAVARVLWTSGATAGASSAAQHTAGETLGEVEHLLGCCTAGRLPSPTRTFQTGPATKRLRRVFPSTVRIASAVLRRLADAEFLAGFAEVEGDLLGRVARHSPSPRPFAGRHNSQGA
jgi:hypothetical protein